MLQIAGIGADAARHLAKLGGKVAIVGRNEQRLNQVLELIKSDESPDPLAIKADVTTDAERIIKETIQHFGKLDVLINNAGFGGKTNIENINMDDYDQIMNVNVRSVVELTKYAVEHLAKTKGVIVNVSSIGGLRPRKHYLAYGMSKAAINQFTKSCALELASKGIRVNAINPGVVRTSFFEKNGIFSGEETEEFFNVIKDAYPLGRAGETSDTSAAIEYLASDQSAFVTGLLLTVEGGALLAGK